MNIRIASAAVGIEFLVTPCMAVYAMCAVESMVEAKLESNNFKTSQTNEASGNELYDNIESFNADVESDVTLTL